MTAEKVADFLLSHKTAKVKSHLNSVNRLWLSSTTEFHAL